MGSISIKSEVIEVDSTKDYRCVQNAENMYDNYNLVLNDF